MKYEIETYKGHTIFYNEDTDRFYCEMVIEDSYKKTSRLSLKSVKDEIDQFIKANMNFKPFDVFFKHWHMKKSTVEALRKDGTFHIDRSFLSYNEMLEKCYFYDNEIDSEIKNIEKELEAFTRNANAKIELAKSKLKPLTAEFLDKYKI